MVHYSRRYRALHSTAWLPTHTASPPVVVLVGGLTIARKCLMTSNRTWGSRLCSSRSWTPYKESVSTIINSSEALRLSPFQTNRTRPSSDMTSKRFKDYGESPYEARAVLCHVTSRHHTVPNRAGRAYAHGTAYGYPLPIPDTGACGKKNIARTTGAARPGRCHRKFCRYYTIYDIS